MSEKRQCKQIARLFIAFSYLIFAQTFIQPAAAATRVPTVKSLSLLNSSNGAALRHYNPVGSGSTLPLSKSLTRRGVGIRANLSAHPSGTSVRFRLTTSTGRVYHVTATRYPYVFRSGRGSGHWPLRAGTYNVTATVYRGKTRRSTRASSSTSISFGVSTSGSSASGSGGTVQTTSNSPGSPSSPSSPSSNSKPITKANVDRSIPQLATWEANMVNYGRIHCENLKNGSLTYDQHLAATYYDAEWVFYQIGDYTGDSYWYDCAQRAEAVYRDQYVIPNGGSVPGYWDFSHGLTEDFLRTGDANSKNAVTLLSQNAAFAPDWTPLSSTANANQSREVAYGIMAYLNGERVGLPHRARTETFVQQALSHLDQWFVSQNADYVRPFMFSLTAHALISYNEQIGGNRAILPALKNGADWIWAHCWLPNNRAFKYTDRVVESGGTDPAPDLNLLIAPVYAWIYNQTGDTTYRDKADQIFVGGVDGAWLANGKQFDQNYRLSFHYLKWRSSTPAR